jgi:ABC-type proline/glycine betaine transport system permease subunit
VLDLMQTLPTFVYLIPTLVLFGLGVVPGLISTVIFALPAPIRLTHLGISAVPRSRHRAACDRPGSNCAPTRKMTSAVEFRTSRYLVCAPK